MNTDEKLSGILRAEADRVTPGPEGWDRIREGIAARRRRTAWLRAGTAITAVTAAAVVAIVVIPGEGPGRDQDITNTPTPTPTETSTVPTDAYVGTVWPFTSGEQVDAWRADHGTRTALAQPQTAAEEFARTYLGVPNATAEPGAGSTYVIRRPIEGSTQQVPVTTVTMTQVGGAGGPWSVAKAETGAVNITAPDALVSPLTLRGTYVTVDPAFSVELRDEPDAAGHSRIIAKARATTGPAGWEATLRFDRLDSAGGSLLITEASLADEGIASAAAVPVQFGAMTGPVTQVPTTAPDAFAGVEDGRVAVYSTSTGRRLRYLTEQQPGGGVTEAQVTDDGSTVVYVEGAGTCATSVRSVPVAGGTPQTLATVEGAASSPYYEPEDGFLAYIHERCDAASGEMPVLVTRDNASAPPRQNPLTGRPRSRVQVTGNYATYAGVDGKLYADPVQSGLNGVRLGVEGCTWTAVAVNPLDGSLAAAKLCGSRTEVVEVSSDLGAQFDVLATFETVAVQALDYNRYGIHLLVWRAGASVTGPVERITADRKVLPVTQGPSWPSW